MNEPSPAYHSGYTDALAHEPPQDTTDDYLAGYTAGRAARELLGAAGTATGDYELIVYCTDPGNNNARCIVDIATGPLDAINELIEMHDYRVGKIDAIFGTPILEVCVAPYVRAAITLATQAT